MSITVSVIIPSYNRKFILEKCLNYLGHQSFPSQNYEIIVVDDGSTDDTETMVKGLKLSCPLKYHRLNHSGMTVARNAGINQTQGEIIIFIDSDIIVEKQFVQVHAENHYRRENIIVRGPVIPIKQPIIPVKTNSLRGFYMAYFAAGNISIKKKHLLAAGLFDTEFHEYGWEDLEIGMRLRKLGLKSRFDFRARGYHYQPRVEFQNINEILQKEMERGRMAVLFYQKHPTFEVKLMTQTWAPFFWLDHLFNINSWMDRKDPSMLILRIKGKWGPSLARAALKMLSYHYNQLGILEVRRNPKPKN